MIPCSPSGESLQASSAAVALVRCVRDGDPELWERIWRADPRQDLVAAALASLCNQLLTRMGEITGAGADLILEEFALRLAQLAGPQAG